MAENKKFYIPVEGRLIEVSEEIYVAYYKMERRERYIGEKEREHGVVSYDALDRGDRVGEAAMCELSAESMEDHAIASDLHTRLHRCVNALPKAERDLIHAIYFEGMTEQAYAKKAKMTQSGVSRRRKRVLSKLKMLLDNMGSF